THVTLHHQFEVCLHFRNPKRTGKHTVVAGNTARLKSSLYHAISSLLNRIGRTHLGASWRIAMQADHGCGLNRVRPVDEVEMNHRISLMSLALAAGLHTGLAT